MTQPPAAPARVPATGAGRAGRSAPSAVVIGAGIAGLATAALLARDGYRVEVLERGADVGGRAGSWSADGFRFDTGPSWYLMPEVFDRFFRSVGTSTEEQLQLTSLDPAYRVYFEGEAEPVEIVADTGANLATFERIEPGAGRRLADHLASAQRTYDIALRHFLYTSFTSPRWLAAPEVARQAHRLVPLLTRSLQSRVAARFTDRRLRQILGYPAVFLGSSPDRTPSMYHLMSALDLTGGVSYPQGGFTALITAIAAQAERHGAVVRTGCEVTGITTAPGPRGRARATGVRYRDSAGQEQVVEADVVVGATDLHHVETDLLPPTLRDHSERWWRRHDPGPGGVLVHLGVEGRLPQLTHHTLLFTRDWERNFRDIREGRIPSPASAYVCAPSRTDASVAPPDAENLFILVPVPADPAIGRGGVDGAGDDAVEAAADAAIDRLAEQAGIPDLRERIRVRRTVGPGDFAADLGAWQGSMLGPAHTLRQSAFFRAGNASRKVAGLYFAGAGTIPGIGLPMCLISAEVVTDRIRAEQARRGVRR
ncbi:phytoene desaturase family protein [Georgenia sp. 311]|uniref:phytoene desaturase family protein n=1 Tax=Georgenia sp. 311 TaxID=2585134 RepID=UPI00159BC2D9|nr:phytoene desaturase family protein [Georgenia sp. 311]